jgi:hypothetical protein
MKRSLDIDIASMTRALIPATILVLIAGLVWYVVAKADSCTGTGTAENATTRLCASGGLSLVVYIVFHLAMMGGLLALLRVNHVRGNIRLGAAGLYFVYMVLIIFLGYWVWTSPLFLAPKQPVGFEDIGF